MEEFRLPKLAITMVEGKVARWLKSEGERVSKGEILVEIETDKATAEVESPIDGYLLRILVGEGETAEVDSCLAHLATTLKERPAGTEEKEAEPRLFEPLSGAASGATAPQETVAANAAVPIVKAAPAARKLAREMGIDLSHVEGSGPGGRILPEDVRRSVSRQSASASLLESRKPIIRMLERSRRSVPAINIAKELPAAGLLAARARFPEASVTEILVKAVAMTMTGFPAFRTAIIEDRLLPSSGVHVGVVVDAGDGLAIPVVKNADRHSIAEISQQLRTLRRKVQEKRLTAQDLDGATLSVSNLGMLGVDFFTAIIPPGQAAILAVGRIRQNPAFSGTSMHLVPAAWFNLVVDHRLIDGALAGRFLISLEANLQQVAGQDSGPRAAPKASEAPSKK